MTDQTTEGQAGEPTGSGLPGRMRDFVEMLSQERPEVGLSEVDLLAVVELAEAVKGAVTAMQARATAGFVEGRDARVAEQRAAEEISAREAICRRRATRCEVALARRCSPAQADRHVGLAASLVHDLPHTMSALGTGEIGEWRATIVARETACLSHEDRLEADRRLAGDLTRLGDRALAAAAHRATVDLDQEALVRRRAKAVASRSVTVRPAPDGMAWLSVLGPMVDVVGAFAALKVAEQGRWVATGDPQVDAARAADQRGRGAWMADTALELLSGRAPGQPQPVEVSLVMSEGLLLGTGDGGDGVDGEGVAEVLGHGAIPGQVAREHLLRLLDTHSDADGASDSDGDAFGGTSTATWLRRLWTAPGEGDLVAMDSQRRLFSGGLRRFIAHRDGGVCRVPWCDAPAREVDHVVAAAAGGPTSAANGWGTCRAHNLAKEAPGWSARTTVTGLDPGGGAHEVVLTTPTGRDYAAPAPPLLGHGRPRPRPARPSGFDIVTDFPFEISLEDMRDVA